MNDNLKDEPINVDKVIIRMFEKLKEDPFIVYPEKDLQIFLSIELLDQNFNLYPYIVDFREKKIEIKYYKYIENTLITAIAKK